jgi:hypothetical protein
MAKKTSHFDELAQDTGLANAERFFRITMSNSPIYTVMSQLIQRFTEINNIIAKFSKIFPKCFVLNSGA